MSTKKTYWLTDGLGAKAFVEGVEERDRWVPRGWAEAGEPVDGDKVWMWHDGIDGPAQFNASVVATWQGLGWEPGPPPEPVDLLHDQHLVDPLVADTASAPKPAAAPVAPSTTSAASGATKEK